MRILKKDLKRGEIMLKLENPEDLWHLYHVLQPGDMIRSKTMRKISVKRGGEFKLSEKKPMTLTITLEKPGFDETTGTLRLTGKIASGPSETPLISYHTLQIKVGTVLTVRKGGWSNYQLKRLEESRIRHLVLLICVLDREEADIALLMSSGMKIIGHIRCEDPENRDLYYSEITRFISAQKGWDKAVIAGPGFEAENLMKRLQKNSPETAGKAILERSSNTGITGINEVIKRSGDKILRDTRIGRESVLVEDVLSRIKSNGLVTYGKEQVSKAINLGAVETIVVSREKIAELEPELELCEKMGGVIRLITSDHELGEQFLHLGGIAALLRFKTE